jgi:hypothetical protein
MLDVAPARPIDTAEIWRLAMELRSDVRYWHEDLLSFEQQTNERAKPLPYLLTALRILDALGGRTIVEIGSLRQAMTPPCLARLSPGAAPFRAPACCNDGHSTYFFARSGCEVHSVDIDAANRGAIELSYANLGEPLPANLHLHIPADGIEFLRRFPGRIDLLYLDGWDKGTEGYAESHLEAWLAARPRLSSTPLVAIDDTDFDTPTGGKDALLTPVLLREGYVPLLRGRMTLFLRAG